MKIAGHEIISKSTIVAHRTLVSICGLIVYTYIAKLEVSKVNIAGIDVFDKRSFYILGIILVVWFSIHYCVLILSETIAYKSWDTMSLEIADHAGLLGKIFRSSSGFKKKAQEIWNIDTEEGWAKIADTLDQEMAVLRDMYLKGSAFRNEASERAENVLEAGRALRNVAGHFDKLHPAIEEIKKERRKTSIIYFLHFVFVLEIMPLLLSVSAFLACVDVLFFGIYNGGLTADVTLRD